MFLFFFFFSSVKCVVSAKNCHFGEIKTLNGKKKEKKIAFHVHENTRKNTNYFMVLLSI
jgi:hypothetical protein